jgi:hypothetical protein
MYYIGGNMKSLFAVVCVFVMTLGCAQLGDFFGGLLDNPAVIAVLEECGDLPAAEFDECAVETLKGFVDPDTATMKDYLDAARKLQELSEDYGE